MIVWFWIFVFGVEMVYRLLGLRNEFEDLRYCCKEGIIKEVVIIKRLGLRIDFGLFSLVI